MVIYKYIHIYKLFSYFDLNYIDQYMCVCAFESACITSFYGLASVDLKKRRKALAILFFFRNQRFRIFLKNNHFPF